MDISTRAFFITHSGVYDDKDTKEQVQGFDIRCEDRGIEVPIQFIPVSKIEPFVLPGDVPPSKSEPHIPPYYISDSESAAIGWQSELSGLNLLIKAIGLRGISDPKELHWKWFRAAILQKKILFRPSGFIKEGSEENGEFKPVTLNEIKFIESEHGVLKVNRNRIPHSYAHDLRMRKYYEQHTI